MVKPKPLELRVVFDTNALYTGSAHYFIRKEVADLIAENKGLPDLQLSWYVPSIVRDERHFQMRTEALRFLDPITKLERLLGHNLNITPEILDGRVNDAIGKQVAEHTLTLLPFEPAGIDWVRLSVDAAFRRPPFQPGEKEKGFRDALVLESFVQLIGSSNSSPTSCRIALVSADELLRTAAAARTVEANNVHIFDSIEALKGLINTLGSRVDEQFITALQPKADKLFYTSGDESTLYYRLDVYDQLKATLAAASVALPDGASRYIVEEWSLSPPRFLRKQAARVSWVSRFTARLKALKALDYGFYSSMYKPTTIITPSLGAEQSIVAGLQPSASTLYTVKGVNLAFSQPAAGTTFYPVGSVKPGLLSFPETQPVATGAANIDVTWTVTVTTALALKSPKLDTVTFVDATWDPS